MPNRCLVTAGRILAAALLCLFAGVSAAGATPADFQALVNDVQSVSPDPNRIGFVFWLPAAFWREMGALDPSSAPEQTEEVAALVEPYLVFGIADGTIGPMGGASFFSQEKVLSTVRLRDAAGTVYTPLAEDRVSPDVRNLMAALGPILAGIVGPMGENMHFVYFPSHNQEGKAIGDPAAEGGFTVILGDQEHPWRLPLASLIPKKVCPVDGEELNGTWSYCPWHGARLEAAKAPTTAPVAPAAEAPATHPPPGG